MSSMMESWKLLISTGFFKSGNGPILRDAEHPSGCERTTISDPTRLWTGRAQWSILESATQSWPPQPICPICTERVQVVDIRCIICYNW